MGTGLAVLRGSKVAEFNIAAQLACEKPSDAILSRMRVDGLCSPLSQLNFRVETTLRLHVFVLSKQNFARAGANLGGRSGAVCVQGDTQDLHFVDIKVPVIQLGNRAATATFHKCVNKR